MEQALQSTSLQELTVDGLNDQQRIIDGHLLSQAKQVIPNIFGVSEFHEIYSYSYDTDELEEFDPNQFDGPQFLILILMLIIFRTLMISVTDLKSLRIEIDDIQNVALRLYICFHYVTLTANF